MKNFTTALSLLFSVGLLAQTHQIEKHNGQKLDVNFIKHENNVLHYSSLGSSEEHKISKHAVAYLHHRSTSKKEGISPKVIINSKKDISKIIVLHQDQTLGFDSKKDIEIYGTNKGGTTFFINEDSIRRIKYKSAELGYPFVTRFDKTNGKYQAIAYNY